MNDMKSWKYPLSLFMLFSDQVGYPEDIPYQHETAGGYEENVPDEDDLAEYN